MNSNIRIDHIFEMRIKDRNICRPSNHRRVYKTTSPVIIGEFWSSFLYRKDYLAADHRPVLEFFFLQQTELPRR